MNVSSTMSTRFGLSLTLLLGTPLAAQSTLISPPGMFPESSGTLAFSSYLGGYTNQRYQLVDGSQTGTARSLKSLSMRRDTDPGYAMVGRSWQQVSLRLGGGHFESFSSTFSQNFRASPALLFEGAVTWSVPTGLSTRPAPFGADGASFPFRVPYVYDGRDDLVCEMEFQGGRRSDAASWNTGFLLPYYLDGVTVADYQDAKNTRLGLATCIDSGHSQAGLQRLFLRSHSSTSPFMPDQIYHFQEVYNLPAGAPVLQAIGLPMPAALPATHCTQLWVAPIVVLRGTTDAGGYLRTSLGSATYDSKLVGLTLASQTAWTDSAHRRLMLTDGMAATIQAKPQANNLRMAAICTTSGSAPLSNPYGLDLGRNQLPVLAWGL